MTRPIRKLVATSCWAVIWMAGAYALGGPEAELALVLTGLALGSFIWMLHQWL